MEQSEPSFMEVLANREFAKLLSGQVFSNLGDAILRAGILLYVYFITKDESITTLVLSLQLLPWIVIGPIAGVFADRTSRKRIMVSADIIRSICLILIPFTRNIMYISILSLIVGTASAAFTAPRSAAIPEITGMRLFVKGISLAQMVFQTIGIIGPLAAAFVYAALGPHITFGIAAFGYAMSATIISQTWIPDAKPTDEKTTVAVVRRDLVAGIRYIVTNPVTFNVIILFTVLIFGLAFAGPLILPYIFRVIHHSNTVFESQSQKEYGIIGSLTALGSIVGNLLFGRFERQITRAGAIFFGAIATGLYLMAFMLIPTITQLGLLAVIFGTFNGMMSLAVNAVFAENVPNELRGRAYAATNAYLYMLNFVFTAISGTVASYLGLINAFSIAAVIILVLTIIFTLKTKFRFLHYSILLDSDEPNAITTD